MSVKNKGTACDAVAAGTTAGLQRLNGSIGGLNQFVHILRRIYNPAQIKSQFSKQTKPQNSA